MRISAKIALCALLVTGCAGTRQSMAPCLDDVAAARGTKDGASGRKANLHFLGSCTAETRLGASSAYREAYSAARARHKAGKFDTASLEASSAEEAEGEDSVELTPAPLVLQPPVREPSAVSWVCEIEASSRVFTGAGSSREEALGSARATCGSHFQASYCTKADCKQNM